MPNFHVHWMVALQSVREALPTVAKGMATYSTVGEIFRGRLLRILGAVNGERDLPHARKDIYDARSNWVAATLNAKGQEDLDSLTCFSAYALGACGPDFWTLPVVGSGVAPDFASGHFDLGHYNRSHVQFEKSVEAVGARTDVQALVEQAYFSGMATHFAADLVIHQLVNVSAGAYNLQPKPWRNEQARGNSVWRNIWSEAILKGIPTLLAPPGWPSPPNWRPFLDDNLGNTLGLWSTHNKVEHYWDSYVRHRYLGDVGPIFGAADTANWNGFTPLGLPTCEGLWRQLGRDLGRTPPASVANLLREPEVMWAVEKPLTLPWLFCERVRRGQIKPFLYERVVHPIHGAYPDAVVPDAVRKEKTHSQMQADERADKALTGRSEARRLEFFANSVNDNDSRPISWNYLNYFVCPDVSKVVAHGKDVFYHFAALGPFIDTASGVAGTFLSDLNGAYADRNPEAIGRLRHFWNLDTGLGVRVQKVPTDTAKDVITRIDLIHVLEATGQSIAYTREVPWLPRAKQVRYDFPEGRAFEVREQQKAFESLASISEPDDKAYLECIRLAEEARAWETTPYSVEAKAFWTPQTAGHACSVTFPTRSLASEGTPVVQLLDIGHRLTLQFRVAIADLGRTTSGDSTPHEKLALFAVADKEQGLDGACTDSGHDWVEKFWVKKKGVTLDYSQKPEVKNGLQYFSTRILLGFETDREVKRVTRPGGWNNVVAAHDVGRNVAVATGRPLVLHPSVDPTRIPTQEGKSVGTAFQPETQYEVYSNTSPTEQVFFTLFPLVRTRDGVFDLYSRKRVKQDQLEKLIAIDSVGFVKIVLLYDLSVRGALQLDTCYVDGVEVKVETD